MFFLKYTLNILKIYLKYISEAKIIFYLGFKLKLNLEDINEKTKCKMSNIKCLYYHEKLNKKP